MCRSSLILRRSLACLMALCTLAITAHAQTSDLEEVNHLIKSGKLTQALAKIEQSLNSKPRDVQMRFLKGVVQTEQGHSSEAINVFSKLIEDHPELPEPYNNLAALHARSGQHDKAREALEMAVRINPNYAIAHENLGDTYINLANQAYQTALQIGNTSNSLHIKLSKVRELIVPATKIQNTQTGKNSTTDLPVVTKPATTPSAK